MSKIQWTEDTWNPFAGCSKISAGCKNCYAIRDAVRLSGNTNPKIAAKYVGTVSKNNWTGKINLASEETLLKPLRWTRPRLIFVNSMSDLFHENVSDLEIDKVFDVMSKAKKHTFQVLTKRPERMLDYISKSAYLSNSPLENVWLGVSVENQQAADERIPLLLETPAAIRWLSCEPLLEELKLPLAYCYVSTLSGNFPAHSISKSANINWVVVGGESGKQPYVRECDVNWIRSIVQQCQAAKVPVFVKQMGSDLVDWREDIPDCPPYEFNLNHPKGGDIEEFPRDLQVREYPNEFNQA